VSRAQVRQPVNGRGLGRWRGYAWGLAPMIEELERAGALESWRDGAPKEFDGTMPVPPIERPSP